jgi:hypothetical protein
VAAAVAEIAVRRICLVAFGAGYFQFAAAFVAESGVGGIIELTIWALHVGASRKLLRKSSPIKLNLLSGCTPCLLFVVGCQLQNTITGFT